jgi:glycosyltransferase involved in cell wall biosynthesis
MSDKIKILTIGDHPLSPSGVGTQTRYIVEGMLKTGKYEFVSFGGAIKHERHQPMSTEEWKDQWIIWPVDGYGTPDQVRALIHQQKPDILWFMTDPRFYGWLWGIDNEIRTHVPMVYYHVWDNYPYPLFNGWYYMSNDHVACISQLTHDIVKTVSPKVDSSYIPHAVDAEIFKPLDEKEVAAFKAQRLGIENKDKFLFFWNSRNARRKQSGSLLYWFKDFLDKVGHDKAVLIMHTDPKDDHGQDLEAIINVLGMTGGEVLFSREKVSNTDLAMVCNMADCTLGISDAEGFGLSTLESLACGTPIIVTNTGGLQQQVTKLDEVTHDFILKRNSEVPRVREYECGIGINPASQAIIGSQQVPYIYEDRLDGKDVVEAMLRIYNMSPEERKAMGQRGLKFTQEEYSFDDFIERWDNLFMEIHDKHGSWETRKNFKPYEVRTY